MDDVVTGVRGAGVGQQPRRDRPLHSVGFLQAVGLRRPGLNLGLRPFRQGAFVVRPGGHRGERVRELRAITDLHVLRCQVGFGGVPVGGPHPERIPAAIVEHPDLDAGRQPPQRTVVGLPCRRSEQAIRGGVDQRGVEHHRGECRCHGVSAFPAGEGERDGLASMAHPRPPSVSIASGQEIATAGAEPPVRLAPLAVRSPRPDGYTMV